MLLYLPGVHNTTDKRKRQVHYNPKRYTTPSNFHSSLTYEDVWIKCADDIYIHCWLVLQKPSVRNDVPTIMYFHGNAGNIGYRLESAYELFGLNVNILMVEYRGYGNSEGSPTEPGFKAGRRSLFELFT
eukprot:UN03634